MSKKMSDVFALPLKVEREDDCPYPSESRIEDNNGNTVIDIAFLSQDSEIEILRYNLEFEAIALAVNEHDKLTKQLEIAVEALERIEEYGCHGTDSNDQPCGKCYECIGHQTLVEIKKIEEQK